MHCSNSASSNSHWHTCNDSKSMYTSMRACPTSIACTSSVAPALPPGSHLLLLNCRSGRRRKGGRSTGGALTAFNPRC